MPTPPPLEQQTLLTEAIMAAGTPMVSDDLPQAPVSEISPRFDWDWADQQAYLLALHQVSDLGPRTLLKALKWAKTPKRLWQATMRELQQGLPPKALAGLLAAQKRMDPERELARYALAGVQVLCWGHPDYPRRLLATYEPPVVLFLRGSVTPLDCRCLGVVGTRKISAYGQQVVSFLSQSLKPYHVCIVSGLAYGVDIAAHRQALQLGLPTVAVLGSGIDVIQPTHHVSEAQRILDDGGAIVSEYPLGVQADKYTFPRRNRIIAGLSDGVVVVEGQTKSGSLITANYANDEGRTVFAVPGNVFSALSAGPHQLIQQGAVLLTSPNDIVRELNWDKAFISSAPGSRIATATPPPLSTLPALQKRTQPTRSKSPKGVLSDASEASGLRDSDSGDEPSDLASPVQPSDEATQVLKTIGYDPTPVGVIQAKSGLAMDRLGQLLTLLELDDQVVSLPGPQFVRKR
jgi:DNA processing protein